MSLVCYSPCKVTRCCLLQILCLHGGIPYHGYGDGLLNDIEDIPTELSDPEMESLLAWDLMWNDPLRYVNILLLPYILLICLSSVSICVQCFVLLFGT